MQATPGCSGCPTRPSQFPLVSVTRSTALRLQCISPLASLHCVSSAFSPLFPAHSASRSKLTTLSQGFCFWLHLAVWSIVMIHCSRRQCHLVEEHGGCRLHFRCRNNRQLVLLDISNCGTGTRSIYCCSAIVVLVPVLLLCYRRAGCC